MLVAQGLPARAATDKPVAKPAAKGTAPGTTPAAAADAAHAAAPPDDPMERLRQRLAERLATPGTGPASGTLDLQMGTRAPAAGAARRDADVAPRKASHAGAVPMQRVEAPLHAAAPTGGPAAQVRRAAAAHPPAAGQAHWGYEGAAGPAAWGGLRPDFNLCANGQRQSPIDIRGGLAVELDPVKFDYRPTPFSVIDNGHTVQVNLQPGNAIELGGRRYELVQFHFHRPSEERIDGRQFEMSLHLVHKDAAGKLAVVGVLLGKGPVHPVVQAVWNNLPLEKNEEAPARAPLDPSHLLPEDKRYFTYMGSLTTPPCSEGVLWVVMRTPVTVTEEQLALFARIYPMNARPAQPVAGRRIMQSQ
jgi:carbonic anhydrase